MIADGRDNIAAELAPVRAAIGLPRHIDWDVLGRVAYTMVDTQTGRRSTRRKPANSNFYLRLDLGDAPAAVSARLTQRMEDERYDERQPGEYVDASTTRVT